MEYNVFQQMINEAERRYEAQLHAAAAEILASRTIHVVTVSGPTCSGKTTTTEKLKNQLVLAGHPVFLVSFDDFFRNRDTLPKNTSGRVDYDTAASLDLTLLGSCLERLVRGEQTILPKYDFKTGTRCGTVPYIPHENDLILLEGIQAMYPEIRQYLPQTRTYSMVIMPNADVTTPDGKIITAREIRLLRRLVRDVWMRGTSAEKTLSMWADVCANEDANIFPYVAQADFRMDSYLDYELYIIAPLIRTLLADLPKEREGHAYAKDLLVRLSAYQAMPADGVPRDSVFREFIG